LSIVALIAGWITTEVGRQPWIVYDVMKVDQAVTGAKDIPVGYGALSVAYLILAIIVVAILRRLARIPLEEVPDAGLCARGADPGRHGGVYGARRRGLRRRALDAAG
jgi:cytochrome bd-type quinol oxidase subunit 1